MTRWIFAAVLAAATVAAGCNKPAEGDCRKAIRNMQRLLGTDKLHSAQNVEAAVRSCRGASKKSSVECAIQAQTLDQLKACPFYHEQGLKDDAEGSGSGSGTGSATGSGSGSAPAAGSGSAPAAGSGTAAAPGSGTAAGSGSAAGSGTAAAPGSGTAAGSGSAAAPGSGTAPAAGSASGSAAAAGSGK